jgi:uncharacterized protein (TIGR03067 family)
MKSWLLAVALLGLLTGRGAGEPADKGDDKLAGTWSAVSAVRNGQAADEVKGHELTFADGKFVIKSKGKVLYEGTYTVDAAKKPATIDFKHTEGALKGKTWKGIYLVDGDTLKTCDNSADLAKERPTAFEAPAKSGCIFIVFKRAKS